MKISWHKGKTVRRMGDASVDGETDMPTYHLLLPIHSSNSQQDNRTFASIDIEVAHFLHYGKLRSKSLC